MAQSVFTHLNLSDRNYPKVPLGGERIFIRLFIALTATTKVTPKTWKI